MSKTLLFAVACAGFLYAKPVSAQNATTDLAVKLDFVDLSRDTPIRIREGGNENYYVVITLQNRTDNDFPVHLWTWFLASLVHF
ncbi:MAG: hypothetical protein EOP49_01365 [Sphingobacteriales bacterium]|nr:MAG: hypothetical protein EOP49_01365 [Sphingobacteriales bacterium]